MPHCNLKEKMTAVYHTLTPYEQYIVQLLALLYQSYDRGKMLRVIAKAGFFPPGRNEITKDELAGMLKKLKESCIVVSHDRCNSAFIDDVAHYIDGPKLEKMAATILQFKGEYIQERDLRLAIYTRNIELFKHRLHNPRSLRPDDITRGRIFSRICGDPARIDWFSSLPTVMQAHALKDIVFQAIDDIKAVDHGHYKILEAGQEAPVDEGGQLFRENLAELALLQGNLPRAREIVEPDREMPCAKLILASCAFLEGNDAEALDGFKDALRSYKKMLRRRNIYFDHFAGIIYLIALVKDGSGPSRAQIFETLAYTEQHPYYSTAYDILRAFVFLLDHKKDVAKSWLAHAALNKGKKLFRDFFVVLCSSWIELVEIDEKRMEEIFHNACAAGYTWIALECAEILVEQQIEEPIYKKYLEKNKKLGIRTLHSIFRREESWQRSLTDLENFAIPNEFEEKQTNSKARLAWFLDFRDDHCRLIPKKQTQKANGNWTAGKKIPMYSVGPLDCITAQDQDICEEYCRSGYYYAVSYYPDNFRRPSDWEKAICAMVGHPHVYLAGSPRKRVEIYKGDPELVVENREDFLHIGFDVDILDRKIVIIRETQTRIKVIVVTQKQRDIADILGKNGLMVPLDARERVLKILQSLSSSVKIRFSLK